MAVERSEIASSIDLLSDADDHEDNSVPSASKKLKASASAKTVSAAKYRTKFHCNDGNSCTHEQHY